MSRGGKRVGTVGRGYTNRTDLLTQRAPQTGMANAAEAQQQGPQPIPTAAGAPGAGSGAPLGGPPPATGPMGPTPINPDHVTPLDAPTDRPAEPLTTGMGAGTGASAQAATDLAAMKVHLPFLSWAAEHDPNTPASVVAFVNYLQGQVGQ